MDQNLDNLKNELLNDHWKHAYNWAGMSIGKLSERYNCSMDDVRHVMARIAQEHPKPKAKANEDTCKTCFAPIVWIGKHPCDPPVIKGVDAAGKVHAVRQSHFVTCPQADQHRKAKR